MLTITPAAAQAIESLLTWEGGPGSDGGIRIARERAADGGAGLTLALATVPEPDDEVIVQQGARIFLDPETTRLLADKVLDARVEETSVDFEISER
jgi:Fe-S cluster assembly iron-binding protein IscA